MIRTMRCALNDWALRHGGFGPDEAFIMLNPLYWCKTLSWRLSIRVQRFFNKHLGLDRVVLKDEHEQCESTLTMVRDAEGEMFKVICEITYITRFETLGSSKAYTRRVYDLMRRELWAIIELHESSAKGADDFDRYLESVEDFQSRWQRYAVCLV